MPTIPLVEKHIVLNYDLGFKGDYQNLYAFLDEHKAVDCGNCNAAFAMSFSKDDFDVIYTELRQALEQKIQIEPNDRIYMTVTDATNKMKGKFLFGYRKRAIWEGYGNLGVNVTDQF